MAPQGAEMLIYPTAIGYATYDTEEEQQRQREAWTTVMRGHAVANGLPNRVYNKYVLPAKNIDEVTKEVEQWAEQRKAEIEMLKQNEVYRKEFLQNLAHEIKHPFLPYKVI